MAVCKRKSICLYLLIALIGIVILIIPSNEPVYAFVQKPTPPADSGIFVTEPVEIPAWISAIEIIVPLLITSLALTIYFVHKTHQASTNKRRKK
jgi:uncharacterized BrkB/YihY/UPF0761 family membrane protein